MKHPAGTSPCTVPTCIALALLNASPVQAECLPSGTPQDDVITCTDVDSVGVDGLGGNDSITVGTAASVVVNVGEATGIRLADGVNTVDHFGNIDAKAIANLDHSDYAIGALFGLVDASASSSATAGSIARGIFSGDGINWINNYGKISSTSTTTATSLASSTAAFGSADATADATALADAAGISLGAGNNRLINFESGTITVHATATVDGTGAKAVADAVGSGDSTARAEATADATGIQADDGHNVIDNRGAVTASSTTNAYGYAGTYLYSAVLPTAHANVDKTSSASATGLDVGHGDNLVTNSGTITANAQAHGPFYTIAVADTLSTSAAWWTIGAVIPLPANAFADTTTTASAVAFGIDVGNGANRIFNSGNILATSTSVAEASAVAQVLSIPIYWEAAATTNSGATAIGVNAGSGDNDITNADEGYISAIVHVTTDTRAVAFTSAKTESLGSVAYGISTGSGNNTISNYGTISVSATLDWTQNAAILDDDTAGIRTGDGNDTIANYGAVEASVTYSAASGPRRGIAIRTGGGNDVVILGTGSSIFGNILLESGDDTLILESGVEFPIRDGYERQTDQVNAGAGSDTLVLGGHTDGIFDLAQVSNAAFYRDFDFFRKQGLSNWTLTGDKTIDWIVDQGRLAIADQLTGTVQTDSASSGAVIDVLSGAQVRGLGFFTPVILDGTGALINRGVIESNFVEGNLIGVLARGNGNYIFNSGQITAYGAGASRSAGIQLNGSDALVLNEGVVRSEGTMGGAVVLAGDGGVVVNHGLLTSVGPVVSFESEAGTGNTLINHVGGVVETASTLAIAGGAGNDSTENYGEILGAVTGAAGDDYLANYAEIHGSIDMGIGDDTVGNYGEILGAVESGEGNDVLDNRGSIQNGVTAGTGDDHVANHGSIFGGVATGPGDDRIENYGEIHGTAGAALDLGDGTDRLMIAASSLIDGTADGGAGTDTFVLGGSVDADFDLDGIDSRYVGFEQFRKEGGSQWVLTGSAAGPWTLAGGALIVNGTLLGDALVESPGRLGGTGAIGSLINRGTVTPGESIGVLNVAGDYVHGPDAVLEIEIDGAGHGDRLDVGGTATLQGGTVQVLPDGPFGIATQYSILDADGGIDGRFANVFSTLDFLDPELDYEPGRIMLTVIRNDFSFASFGKTFNQIAVGSALDANKKAAARGDFKPMMDAFLSLAADEIPAAFDAIDGELHATTQSSLLRGGDAFLTTALDRQLSAWQRDDGNRTAWVDGFGAYSSPDSDGNARGADYRTAGIAMGVDVAAGASTRVGLALGVSNGSTDLQKAGGDSADANSVHAALYAAYEQGPWNLRTAVAYDRHDVDAKRASRYGDVDRVARSSYDASQYSAYLSGRGSIAIATDASLQPFATLAWSQLDRERFTESGADSLDLTVKSETTDSLYSVLGLRAVWDRQWQYGLLRPELSAGWVHQYLDDHGEITASLQGATPSDGYESFTIRGVTNPRNGLLAGAGLVADMGPNSRAFLNYSLVYDSGSSDQAIVAGVRVTW